MAQPPRIAVSLGSTTRLTEFDFSKISVSLERDLVPAENTIDAYRDIKALLERMVSEFQGSKPAGTQKPVSRRETETASPDTHRVPEHAPPATSKPASLTVETLREHLAKWLDKVEVTPTLNGFAVKPRHFLLRETWQAIDDALRTIGAKWIPQAKGVGSWQVPS